MAESIKKQMRFQYHLSTLVVVIFMLGSFFLGLLITLGDRSGRLYWKWDYPTIFMCFVYLALAFAEVFFVGVLCEKWIHVRRTRRQHEVLENPSGPSSDLAEAREGPKVRFRLSTAVTVMFLIGGYVWLNTVESSCRPWPGVSYSLPRPQEQWVHIGFPFTYRMFDGNRALIVNQWDWHSLIVNSSIGLLFAFLVGWMLEKVRKPI